MSQCLQYLALGAQVPKPLMIQQNTWIYLAYGLQMTSQLCSSLCKIQVDLDLPQFS